MKPNVYFAHWIHANQMDFDRQVDIYNVHADEPENKNAYNILNIANEPEPTRMSNKKVKKLSNLYDLILSWDEDILDNCPNAKMFLCGMTWIREQDIQSDYVKNKKFKVTFLAGSKNMTKLHRMRHIVWGNQEKIKIPKTFYHSSHKTLNNFPENPKVGGKMWEKVAMFNAQFHIAIENSRYNNYFTEKLMDCFITRTIPIYIGCPNIDKYFNDKGIIQVDTVKQLISTCNSLDENFYNTRKKYIEENYNLCKEYTRDFTQRLYEKIMEHMPCQ